MTTTILQFDTSFRALSATSCISRFLKVETIVYAVEDCMWADVSDKAD